MSKYTRLLPLAIVALGLCAQELPRARGVPKSTPSLFQVSTLDALASGIYGASFTVGELRRHGDFGVGTYEGLDGEMVALDGHFYHVRANGLIADSPDDAAVPYAAVTHFHPDFQFSIRGASLAQLSDLIDSMLPSKNLFYAARVHGTFQVISTRAIPKQFLPYLPLAQLIPIQSIFTAGSILGTAVDIRSPAYVAGINQVGHHYHFIADDLKTGGHALSFTTGEVTVQVQVLRQYSIWLPGEEPFLNATLPAQ